MEAKNSGRLLGRQKLRAIVALRPLTDRCGYRHRCQSIDAAINIAREPDDALVIVVTVGHIFLPTPRMVTGANRAIHALTTLVCESLYILQVASISIACGHDTILFRCSAAKPSPSAAHWFTARLKT